MIEKLRKKISLIIILAITIPLISIVTVFDISYCNSTIRANSQFVDRMMRDPNDKKENPKMISDMDGVYSVSIRSGKIIETSDNITDEIKEYALEVLDKENESGIIGNYIYRREGREMRENDASIVLIESKDEINKIKLVIVLSIIFMLIGVILVVLLARKIAEIIVKPVLDTFNKQRDFISDASHELKTPLAVIEANADVLEGEIGKNKWLSYIQNETDNMSKLINELLLLTKIENIDKLREPEEFNMSKHIELVSSSFESMAFEKNVKIENKIEKNIITNTFNKDDITHILSTLIDNAIKHTEEKKKVIVELKKFKDKIKIDVKNKGIEIPIEEREKIFERFYRIDKSRNRNEKRYGLGLSIAKAIVLKNNGTIIADYQDGYTVFTVELPK